MDTEDIKKELRDHYMVSIFSAVFIEIVMVALMVVNIKDIVEMGCTNAEFMDWLLVVVPLLIGVYEIFNFKMVRKKLKELDKDTE